MSDPHESTDKETQSSPGWTFVNSQGEVMSADEDSESSESSIEVLSFDGNEIVSHRQLVSSHLVEAEVKVTEDAPDTDGNAEDVNEENIVSETQPDSASGGSAEEAVNSLEAVASSDTPLESTVERFPDVEPTDLTPSEDSFSGADTSSEADTSSGADSFSGADTSSGADSFSRADTSSGTGDIIQGQQVHLPEVAVAALCTSGPLHSVSCETTVAPTSTEIGEASLEEADEAVADDNVFQFNTENAKERIVMSAVEDISQSADVSAKEPVVMNAVDNISQSAGNVSAKEPVVMNAVDDISLSAGDVGAKKPVVMNAVDDISLSAGDVSAKEPVVMNAVDDISLSAGDVGAKKPVVMNAVDDISLSAGDVSAKEPVVMNAVGNISLSAGDVGAKESQEIEEGEANAGACCMELLLEGIGNPLSAHSSSDANEEIQKSPISFPLSFDEECIAQFSLEGAIEDSLSGKTDSDADSDFVRLDPDNMDTYGGEVQFNEERISIPLRLYPSGYTIRPGFYFIGNNERSGDRASADANLIDNIELDRDDDTESSAEEGIDDRIESEQSEAGSLSAQNDVGDLSVFADIGDLPLVAGDVPRNYIHRPNNHLSTVLNIIVVLVAILTMGISLGIIMATDMEIEEWQNSYEFQTRKVNQLEILLKAKTKAHELQLSRVKELEAQVVDLKNSVWTFERRGKNCERAVETLAAYSSLEGGSFGKVMHTILDGMKGYIQCQTESNQLVAVDCHLKLLPYIRNYTALIKHDLPLDEPTNIDLDVPVNAGSLISEHLGTPQEVTAEAPGFAASSELDCDSQQAQEEDATHFQTEDYTSDTQSDSEHIFSHLERINLDDRVDSSEMPSASHESPESDQSSYEDSRSSSEHSDQGTAKETFRASPVPIDIKQLLQSLTREQERALHWQQLYLSERRQKERERDNEELEDEREREMAEKERTQMDQVECLKKLMSANLTTLTQHVIRWNVSVFDDFANLSMLLSGISDLQQAVLDSVQRVWRSAEQVIDSLQGKDPITEEQSFKKTVSRKEDVVEYLGKLLDRIKKVDMPDHDVLVEYLGKMLDHVKHGVEDILNEVFTESVTASINNVWENTEEIFQDYHHHEHDGEKAEDKTPDREHLLEYLSKVLNDICHKDDVVHEAHSTEEDNKDENIVPEIPEQKGQSDSSFTGPQLETPLSGPHLEEEKPIKPGFWSRRIGKMLKKTGKTVRKLGRKVTGTWSKIKAMWNEKRPSFFKMGNGLASTIKKASSKFARMCKRMSSGWFKTAEITEVEINSKYVHRLRKHWQKIVLKDPCQILGKFSYECNSGKKQCQRDLNKISDSFSHLLKISNITRDHVLKLNVDALEWYRKQLKSFQDQWWKSKLLLKTDKLWVECQLNWWSAAVTASYHGNVDALEDNKCNKINLSYNFHEVHHGKIFGPTINILAEDIEEKVDCDDNKGNPVPEDSDVQSQQSRSGVSLQENGDAEDDDHEEKEEEHTHKDEGEHNSYIPNSDEEELNETSHDASDWLHQQAKLRLHSRREKEKARWVFEQATNKNKERYSHWKDDKEADDNEKHYGDWFSEKSQDREKQRKEAGKSSWIFDRAGQRRDARQKWVDDHYYKKENKHHNRATKKSDDWYLKQAEERQKIRENEHKSDWLFERAADRRRNQGDKRSAQFRKQRDERHEHGRQFRHAYGKVSTP